MFLPRWHRRRYFEERRDNAEVRSREKIKAAFVKKHMAKMKAEKAGKKKTKPRPVHCGGDDSGDGGAGVRVTGV